MSLPIDRTNLTAAQTNQVPNALIRSALNIAALQTPYDTIDELNNKVNALIAAGVLSPYPPAQFNKLINGSPDIWQNGTTFTFASSNGYIADNWFFSRSGTGSTTVVQDTTIPANGKTKYSVSCVGSYGIGEFQDQKLVIESVNAEKLSNQQVNISLQHKESVTAGSTSIQVIVKYASAADDFTTTDTITTSVGSVSSTFALYSFSVTLPTTSPTSNYPIGNGIQITIRHIQSAAIGTLSTNVCQVQLCMGSTALPFQAKDYEAELISCQRLFQKSFKYSLKPAQNTADFVGSLGATQFVGASTLQYGIFGTVQLPVKMRKIPTVTTYNISAANAQVRNFGTNTDCTSTTVSNVSEGAFRIDATTPAGSVLGQLCAVHFAADARIVQ